MDGLECENENKNSIHSCNEDVNDTAVRFRDSNIHRNKSNLHDASHVSGKEGNDDPIKEFRRKQTQA